MYTTKIVSFIQAIQSLRESSAHDQSFLICSVILFGGDRGTCCDEAAIVEVDGRVVALASIAPNGEQDSGLPTIVGLYTVTRHRRKGFGKIALETAIDRMRERGMDKIHIDTLTKGALAVIDSLSVDTRAMLDINDQSAFGACLE